MLHHRLGNEHRYDGHGNLIEKRLADGKRWRYAWSPSGRLVEVERPDGKRVAFAYDALGRRVRKECEGTSTEFVWDGDDLVHERVTKDGARQPLVTWMFEPGTFAPVAKFEGRRRYAVVTDHLGTPAMLMTEDGRLAWKGHLDVYGVVREERAGIEEPDATANPWRYPGQFEDTETGLYYNRFRYYDPENSRYLSHDPLGPVGGFEAYSYTRAPTKQIDPLGLANVEDAIALRQAMKDAGISEPSFSSAAHHIVKSNDTDPLWEAARNHMESLGISKNSAENGVFLASNSSVAKGAGVSSIPHSKIHTNAYRDYVVPLILSAKDHSALKETLAQIRKDIEDGKPIHKSKGCA